MELLEMNLPSYQRFQYPTNPLRDEWSAKMVSATRLSDLQVLSVLHGLRKSTLVLFDKRDIADKMNELTKLGLTVVPIDITNVRNNYTHKMKVNNVLSNFRYYCFVTNDPSLVPDVIKAKEAQDHTAFGKLLGYPTCCIEHYVAYSSDGVVDPVWHQAANTAKDFFVTEEERLVRVSKECPVELVTAFRYVGVELVHHLPCSLTCEASLQIVRQLNDLAKELGYGQSLQDAYDILSLPFEWDNLKGNAIISTPAFKFMVDSNTCVRQHVVQKESGFYPEGAPTAVKFPWKQKGGCS